MKKLILTVALTSALGCTSIPQVEDINQPDLTPKKNNFESNTTLAVTDTCNATLVIATALTFPFWTIVPLTYGIFTHLTWEDNPDDGTKEVLSLFSCTALLPIYAL